MQDKNAFAYRIYFAAYKKDWVFWYKIIRMQSAKKKQNILK